MCNKREAVFRIIDIRVEGKRFIGVRPSLKGINRSNGGEDIMLAIAANCVRVIAKRDGLERALERFTDMVINRTRVARR